MTVSLASPPKINARNSVNQFAADTRRMKQREEIQIRSVCLSLPLGLLNPEHCRDARLGGSSIGQSSAAADANATHQHAAHHYWNATAKGDDP